MSFLIFSELLLLLRRLICCVTSLAKVNKLFLWETAYQSNYLELFIDYLAPREPLCQTSHPSYVSPCLVQQMLSAMLTLALEPCKDTGHIAFLGLTVKAWPAGR